jgi:hypothetical protein
LEKFHTSSQTIGSWIDRLSFFFIGKQAVGSNVVCSLSRAIQGKVFAKVRLVFGVAGTQVVGSQKAARHGNGQQPGLERTVRFRDHENIGAYTHAVQLKIPLSILRHGYPNPRKAACNDNVAPRAQRKMELPATFGHAIFQPAKTVVAGLCFFESVLMADQPFHPRSPFIVGRENNRMERVLLIARFISKG